jgi:hypothetical protein
MLNKLRRTCRELAALFIGVRHSLLKRRYRSLQLRIVRYQLKVALLQSDIFRLEACYQRLQLCERGRLLPVLRTLNEAHQDIVNIGDFSHRVGQSFLK